ncbi:MAG: GNAT family N-acetyltransferase [Mycoplasmataceae bacterium]|jgi:ribosomal-protein-alanine N-acetyltransferase|nr:GNAT family N-acetyltransferase [Mycoplasmataceae bacterium]
MFYFKKAESSHLSQISEYEQKNFPDTCYSLKQLEDMFGKSDYSFLVALEKETENVVGYLIAQVSEGMVDIFKIFVKEEYRRCKIATSLLRYIIGQNLKSDIILEVAETNTSAISFYLKHNFKIVAKRNGYYKNGVDALIMLKEQYEK